MTTYDKNNPFHAKLKARRLLTKDASSKKTYHLEIDLSGSGIQYSVGDSVAVLPLNPLDVVKKLLKLYPDSSESIVTTRQYPGGIFFELFLKEKANLSALTKKLFSAVLENCPEEEKQMLLEESGFHEQEDLWKAYCEKHHVVDFLEAHLQALPSPQKLADSLQPLLPRFYSIASSQKKVGDEVHLTIATVSYSAGDVPRVGVCTHYLCEKLEIGEELPLYLQPNHGFTLPENALTPIIMVGPGTGVAPFRAFMQERALLEKNGPHWLFFGERNSRTDFLYEDEWLKMEKQGLLRLSKAFSRDQIEKVYVQHKMLEESLDLWKWLEEGAVFFVCGDASVMAKDVEKTLLQIIEKEGKKSREQAQDYLKKLRKEKRYLKDVY